MKRYFTHHWTNPTFEANKPQAGKLLRHTAGNQFRKRGIETGDNVYVVTIFRGQLFLVGRLEVAQVCSRSDAQTFLETDDVWDARDHLIASSCTPMFFDLKIPLAKAQQLMFLTNLGLQPLLIENGLLHPQTIRGVRELEAASVRFLNEVLPPNTPVDFVQG